MTFFHFFITVLFLYVADENNPSQLHFGKKCLKGEQGIVYSHLWVTKPNQPLPVSKDQCRQLRIGAGRSALHRRRQRDG